MRITVDKEITSSGHSLILVVTREMRRMGLDRGDVVRVTLESDDDE